MIYFTAETEVNEIYNALNKTETITIH